MLFFQKNAVFIYKSKSAISLLLMKLESWNLVCIWTKYIFFSSWNFIALTLAVWRWHDFENFKWIFKIGAQIFLTCIYHNHDLHDFEYLYVNFQALFQKSRVLSSTTWTIKWSFSLKDPQVQVSKIFKSFLLGLSVGQLVCPLHLRLCSF